MFNTKSTNKIICVGRNYSEHAKELNNPIPKSPVFFMKPVSCIVDMSGDIEIPSIHGDVHHELEIYVLIGKDTSIVKHETSLPMISSIGLALDLTLRDIQQELKKQGLPWEKAKCFDGACPMSNAIDIDSSIDLEKLELQFFKNGVLQQHGHTSDMIHSIKDIIEEASKFFRLNEGDIILTGTPSGVSPLKNGDALKSILKHKKHNYIEINSTIKKSV